MLTKKILGLAFLIVIVLSTIPFVVYYSMFGHVISSRQEVWGQFGDFIGGILNPVLSLANLLVLGYLTYELSNIDQNSQKVSLATQKKLVLSQLRQDAFEEYITRIDNVLYNYDDTGSSKNASVGHKANMAWERVKPLNENFAHLFPILKTDNIFEEVGVILLRIRTANTRFSETQQQTFLNDLGLAIEDLKKVRVVIKQKLQNFMMDELNR